MKFDVMALVYNKLTKVVDLSPFFQQDLSHIPSLGQLESEFKQWALANLDFTKINEALKTAFKQGDFDYYNDFEINEERDLFFDFEPLENCHNSSEFFDKIKHFMPIWDIFTLSDTINALEYSNYLNCYSELFKCAYCSELGDFIAVESLEITPAVQLKNLFSTENVLKSFTIEQVKSTIKEKINTLPQDDLYKWAMEYEKHIGNINQDIKEVLFDSIQFYTMKQIAELIEQRAYFDSNDSAMGFQTK